MIETKKRRVLLTGASGGIGEQMARILAGRGYDLVLVARNEGKLREIIEEVKRNIGMRCEYFICDLSKEAEIERLIHTYPETDLLINNAGFGSYGLFSRSPWETERDMVMVNVYALMKLCHHYVKGMIARNYGRILNVASTAGMYPSPFVSTYAVTKAFVIQFSKSLAIELKGYNVSVSMLLPGPTATNFWEVANMSKKVEKSFRHFDSPREVAKFGINLMEQGKIAGVPGWKNRVKKIIKHYLPENVWCFIVRRHMDHQSLYERKMD
jgi:uncharacterized protein